MCMDAWDTLVPFFLKTRVPGIYPKPRDWEPSVVCIDNHEVNKFFSSIHDKLVNVTHCLPRRTLLRKMIYFIASLGKIHLGFNGRSTYSGKVYMLS